MYKVMQSPLDKQFYAVFKNGVEAQMYGDEFVDCPVAHFGGYENAYQLSYAWPKSGNIGW